MRRYRLKVPILVLDVNEVRIRTQLNLPQVRQVFCFGQQLERRKMSWKPWQDGEEQGRGH